MKKTILFKAVIAASLAALIFSSCHRADRPNNIVDYSLYETLETKSFDSDLLVPEESFIETMKNKVEPYLNARMTEDFLECASGNRIHYETFKADNPKGLVLIVHGFCEYTKKYNEMTYYYLNNGYNVVRFDHQGHGYSTRFDENISKATCLTFNSYTEDMNEIVEKVAKPLADGLPMFLFAHSLGGGISTNYIETYPDVFKKAVFNCPMHAIKTGGLGETLTLSICNIMYMLKKQHGYIPGGHDFVPEQEYIHEEFDKLGTTCGARRNYYTSIRKADKNYQVSGATFHWTKECMKGTRKIRSRKYAKKVQIPVLLFQSEKDTWVDAFGHYLFRDNSSNVSIELFPMANHDIYSSQNKYLATYYNEIFKFFEAE